MHDSLLFYHTDVGCYLAIVIHVSHLNAIVQPVGIQTRTNFSVYETFLRFTPTAIQIWQGLPEGRVREGMLCRQLLDSCLDLDLT